jgi:hypothetical protein
MSPVDGKGKALRVGTEGQCDTVHAVAQAGRARPIVEHVAKVPAAEVAVNLGPYHQQAAVSGRAYGIIERLPEAGPSRAAVKLGVRRKEWVPATRTIKLAVPGLLVERAGARPLRGLLT